MSVKLNSRPTGFTIVELLIVIVVIAILASITIVAYNGIQQRAKSAAYVSALQSWEKILRIQNVTNGDWFNTSGYLICLGTNFSAADGFAANQCLRSVPANVVSVSEFSPFSASVEDAINSVPSGLLPLVKVVDPAHSNREGHIRGLVYQYDSAGTTQPFIEYYLDKGTGPNGCIGSDTLEYGAYADDSKRCRRYMQ